MEAPAIHKCNLFKDNVTRNCGYKWLILKLIPNKVWSVLPWLGRGRREGGILLDRERKRVERAVTWRHYIIVSRLTLSDLPVTSIYT